METNQGKILRRYSALTLGVILTASLVLAQPMMQVYGVNAQALEFDRCDEDTPQPDDPLSMNTVRNGNIVKTVHAEKEIFKCLLDQGSIPVIVDVTTYIELYENINTREVLTASAFVTNCLKIESTGSVIGCQSYVPPTTSVPTGSNCEEQSEVFIEFPQEMNTVNKGSIVKTIEAQKEAFECELPNQTEKKVDLIIFTEIYEDLSTQTVLDIQFHVMRCVVLLFDDTLVSDGGERDGLVEGCKFSSIQN